MAEFQEVMRQWQRMCNTMQEKNMSCEEYCPLGHNPTCGELEHASLEEINNAETTIMKWSIEHQEPVYPSFAKYLEQFGIIIRCDGTLEADFFKAHEPMDAGIAQKLGIEPKEAVPWNAQK